MSTAQVHSSTHRPRLPQKSDEPSVLVLKLEAEQNRKSKPPRVGVASLGLLELIGPLSVSHRLTVAWADEESPLSLPSSTAANTSPSAASMDEVQSPSETRLTEAEVERILQASPLIVTEYNKAIIEPAMNNAAKYSKDSKDYYRKIEELNGTLAKENRFFPVTIFPHRPEPPCFFPWYRMYRMEDTDPTPIKSKTFTNPGIFDYPTLTMLQIFSIKFVDKLLDDQNILVHGIVAIRDELDGLRNYVFNRSREQAHKITPESSTLPLISPIRGNSILDGVLIEYNLKVKSGSDRNEDDLELISGCIEYISQFIPDGITLKSRIYGRLGTMDICYAFVKDGIEATIDIENLKIQPGWDLKSVVAFTSGFADGINLYDGSVAPFESLMSSVVAVEYESDLVLRFDIGFNDSVERSQMRRLKSRRVSMQSPSSEFGVDKEQEAKMFSRCLKFTSKKYLCSSDEVVIDDKLRADVTVTWSTMGPY